VGGNFDPAFAQAVLLHVMAIFVVEAYANFVLKNGS
jgi:hypothetical protein